MPVINRLKDIRFEHKMDQGEFADFLEIGQSQYNRYEKNNSQPSLENALIISEKVNKTVNEIFYRLPN